MIACTRIQYLGAFLLLKHFDSFFFPILINHDGIVGTIFFHFRFWIYLLKMLTIIEFLFEIILKPRFSIDLPYIDNIVSLSVESVLSEIFIHNYNCGSAE